MQRVKMSKGTRLVAVAAVVMAMTAFAAAQRGGQQPGGRGGQQAAPTPTPVPAKPLVPVAASSVAANPQKFVGDNVTLTGAVEQNLSKTSFNVDQDKTKSTGKDVLVIAPYLQGPVEANTYVTVIGDLILFDSAEVAAKLKEYKIDLSPEDQARFKGKPVVLASSVINAAGLDVGKKPIPPPTADDLALKAIMTKLGPAQAALRKGLEGPSADVLKEQATLLKAAFTEIETFWKGKGNTEAMGIAADGRKHADAILIATAASKWDDVKAAVTPMGNTCGQCHGKYRERMEDGTFRIKGEH